MANGIDTPLFPVMEVWKNGVIERRHIVQVIAPSMGHHVARHVPQTFEGERLEYSFDGRALIFTEAKE